MRAWNRSATPHRLGFCGGIGRIGDRIRMASVEVALYASDNGAADAIDVPDDNFLD